MTHKCMRRVVISACFAALICGCSNKAGTGSGGPIRDKYSEGFSSGGLVVHGRLTRTTLRQPTEVFHSALGHGYCMAEDSTYEVSDYIRGSGPELITFTQHLMDTSCDSISEEIGLSESIVFLVNSKFLGLKPEGGFRIYPDDGEPRVLFPEDIYRFTIFGDFDALLSTYTEPVEIGGFAKDPEVYRVLANLREKGVLDFRVERNDWSAVARRPADASQAYTDTYLVTMYKYIKLETLLEHVLCRPVGQDNPPILISDPWSCTTPDATQYDHQ